MGINSPVHYMGGKSFISEWVISHFPKHHCFVDVFGGSGVILLNKKPSPVEVYNDKWALLVNFMMIARDRAEELIERLDTLPYARSLHRKWKNEPMPEDDMERAVRFFYILRSSFAGDYGHGWAFSANRNQAAKFRTATTRIRMLQHRFRNVLIEGKDFRDIINTYDRDDTLFYCDPPYYNLEQYYSPEFTEQDHIDLATLLNNIKGKAVLSYYDNPLIQQFYSQWKRDELLVTKSSYGITGDNVHNNMQRPKGTEVLLLNFNEPCNLQLI